MHTTFRKTSWGHTTPALGITRQALSLTMVAFLIAFCVFGCEKQAPTQAQNQPDASGQSFGFEKDSDKLQVGFVTVGPVSDWGWNYQHNQGRLALEARMRDKVRTALVENIPENADAERVMQRMCDQGADLVFSTSYGYADFCMRVASKNPKVNFMQAQAPTEGANVATYNGSIWEAAYVAGVVAASTFPQENRFGFIGAHPIPPINWTVNSFALGVQSINPEAVVDIVYTNSWYDPAAETEAVNSLASSGVKLVYTLVDSTLAAIQAAERNKVYCISHHANLADFAPNYYVTGVIWMWSNLYADVAQRALDGTLTGGNVAGGLKEGYVGLAPFGPKVPESARALAAEVTNKIASGELVVFGGPIFDAQGNLKVEAGQSLTVEQIVSMDWLVKGVRGSRN